MNRFFVRALVLVLAFALFFVMAAPASAAEESAWVELLEYSTVNDSGSNWFRYNGTATVSIPTPYSMRLAKIDMLLTYPENTAPTSVEVIYNGVSYALGMWRINSTTSRVYGIIHNNFYTDVRLKFTRGGTSTAYLEILSCRVSQLVTQEAVANAQVFVDNTYYPTATNIEIPGDSDPKYANINSDTTIRIDVQDWVKFDRLTIWGSASSLAVSSIRVNVGTLGVPFTVSYMTNVTSNEWSEWVTDYGGDTGAILTNPHYYGKSLYCVDIDLTGLDRTYNYNGSPYPMFIYLTGTFPADSGFTLNCQYVNGSIIVPDKSEVTWWNKFTTFLTDLFGGDASEADEFGSIMESQAGAMQDAVDELDQVTKPDVEDLDVSLDQYMDADAMEPVNGVLGAIFGNNIVVSMFLICLTCAFVSYALFGKR